MPSINFSVGTINCVSPLVYSSFSSDYSNGAGLPVPPPPIDGDYVIDHLTNQVITQNGYNVVALVTDLVVDYMDEQIVDYTGDDVATMS